MPATMLDGYGGRGEHSKVWMSGLHLVNSRLGILEKAKQNHVLETGADQRH